MFLKPQFHHGRSTRAFLVQSLPPGWSLQLLQRDVVFSNRFVLPPRCSYIDLIPELELDLKVEMVLLLLTTGTNHDSIFLNVDSFIIQSSASADIVSVSVLDLNVDVV